jgi:AcrR family transcriptional regulator
MTESTRSYSSPLREEQARRTRDLILDAFTELLADRRADDITTKQIADRAGVSQPTVYRHFPDRSALLGGLSERIGELMQAPYPTVATMDDFGERLETTFAAAERFPEAVRAETLLNADPRFFGSLTSGTSRQLLAVVTGEFPQYDQRRRSAIAGLLRCLDSSQSWLRMREEFGVPGSESGPLFRWAVETLIRELRENGYPEAAAQGGDES